jgi:hypothetical protein
VIFVEADILALLLYVPVVPSLVLALCSLTGFLRGDGGDVCAVDEAIFSDMTGGEDRS